MTNWTTFSSVANASPPGPIMLSAKDYPDPTTGNPGTIGPDYTYELSGRLWTRTWARGNPRIQTTYAYNNAGDLETVTFNDGTPSITYTYDRRGRQATVARNSITTTLTYNDPSLPIGESYSGANRMTTSKQYGKLHPVRYWITVGGAQSVRLPCSYAGSLIALSLSHGVNRPLSICSMPSGTNPLGVSFAYAYNAANQRYRVTLNDGSYWFYEYDALGQVRSGKKYWSDGTAVAGQQFEYNHDDIGNRTQTKAGGDASGAGLRPATGVWTFFRWTRGPT